uniref:Uncharacterized protein n=1 Tax=Caenorhabditis japonica TaxID=281687 RepID=A0A8R1EM10_CAEJA
MDYHCDIPLVLTLFKPDFVGINQFTNCADNFPFIRFTGSTTAVSPIASVSLMRLLLLREDSEDRPGSCRTSRRLSYQRTTDTSTPLAFREVLSSSLALGPRQL